MVVPSHPPLPADKVTLRRLAREGRRDFVASLGEGEQQLLELRLSEVLDPLLGKSRITGGYCPMPNEISPLPAMEQAGRQGTILAYPAFSDHQSEIRFLAGEPAEPGPWSCFQPLLDSPEVFPDLVLVPLVAIDGHGVPQGAHALTGLDGLTAGGDGAAANGDLADREAAVAVAAQQLAFGLVRHGLVRAARGEREREVLGLVEAALSVVDAQAVEHLAFGHGARAVEQRPRASAKLSGRIASTAGVESSSASATRDSSISSRRSG